MQAHETADLNYAVIFYVYLRKLALFFMMFIRAWGNLKQVGCPWSVTVSQLNLLHRITMKIKSRGNYVCHPELLGEVE